jgi:penicillin-binding protein 1A
LDTAHFRLGRRLALLAVIGAAVAVFVTARSLPSYEKLKSSQAGQMIVVRANDGSEIVTLGPSYGRWIPYDRIPRVMRDAMVSVEDRRYREHWGVDPLGIARSLMVRVESGRWRQGGSTITQQLARNIFLNNSRTFDRKLREAVLALALEQKFTKDQILELYLNKVYFGGGAYGVDSAARKFFGHSGERLSLAEASIIAGLVKAPSHYSPTADAEAAVGRAKVVLDVMQRNGTITPADAAAVNFKDVKLAGEEGQNSARYFTDWVLPQLDLILPENDQPIEVWTTLDPVMQRAATSAIQGYAPKGAQGAMVSVDRDGAVLAMVGGTDYVTSNYNRATNAVRQPGSAWKLFVYLAALEAGYTGFARGRCAGHDRRVVAAQFGRHLCRRDRRAHRLCLFQEHRGRAARQRGGLRRGGQHGPPLRHHHADQHAALDGAGHIRRARDRHGARLRRGAEQGRVGHALWHPQDHHDRRGGGLQPPP